MRYKKKSKNYLKQKYIGMSKKIEMCTQGCRSLLSIGGDNLQFYPKFALFSTLGGMNLDHDFFSVEQIK